MGGTLGVHLTFRSNAGNGQSHENRMITAHVKGALVPAWKHATAKLGEGKDA